MLCYNWSFLMFFFLQFLRWPMTEILLVEASIVNAILGIPNTCIYQRNIWPCKLSFSCWLQGGSHTQGCGSNKWLFSCCVLPVDGMSFSSAVNIAENAVVTSHSKKKDYHLNLSPTRKFHRRHGENKKEFFSKIELKKNKTQCGIDQTFPNMLQKRIIGGRPAYFAENPWQAYIRIAEYQCGGVLVSINMIATAAHCIHHAHLQDIIVYLGELDTQNIALTTKTSSIEKHYVNKKIIHPLFEFRILQPDRYDVGLLKLAKPTSFSKHIQPICLPYSQQPIILLGRKGLIAGWGKTEFSNSQTGTNMLQVASVHFITPLECLRWHESKQIKLELFHEMFCAGHSDGHQDACLGDSGGPLIVKDRGRFTLVGIISAGFGCGMDHQPGIYHNIQKTSMWIQKVIQRNKI